MNTLQIITACVCGFGMFVVIVLMIKNNVTYKNHMKISGAIYRYCINEIDNGNFNPSVDFDDEESYERTLFRIYDWGYKRILPPDKFEKIKPFIES